MDKQVESVVIRTAVGFICPLNLASNMRQLLVLLTVAMLALSVSGSGESGVNESTSTEGTGISDIGYGSHIRENTNFYIEVRIDSDSNISKIDWITQVCINSGICWPPKSQELVEFPNSNGQTFVGELMIDDYATYVNWRFDITRTNWTLDESTETIPESGFGWKVWSDCWYDNETWGGWSTDCQEEEKGILSFLDDPYLSFYFNMGLVVVFGTVLFLLFPNIRTFSKW